MLGFLGEMCGGEETVVVVVTVGKVGRNGIGDSLRMGDWGLGLGDEGCYWLGRCCGLMVMMVRMMTGSELRQKVLRGEL